MAINLITAPTPVAPASLDDYVAQNNLTEALNLMMEQPLRVISGDIPESAVFQIGGAIYRADSDTAITGVASDYVKITPAGATASAAYVADLSGVTWNSDYNGYYDVSGNLYIFNEGLALAAGEIATVFGRFAMQLANGDTPVIGNGKALIPDVIDIGDWDMDADGSKAINYTFPNGFKTVRAVTGIIRNDVDNAYYPIPSNHNTTDMAVNFAQFVSTGFNLRRATGGTFDNTAFDSTSYNRGWITIWYEIL